MLIWQIPVLCRMIAFSLDLCHLVLVILLTNEVDEIMMHFLERKDDAKWS